MEAALRRENVELPAGTVESFEREFTVRVERSYGTAGDFAALVLRQGSDGYLRAPRGRCPGGGGSGE